MSSNQFLQRLFVRGTGYALFRDDGADVACGRDIKRGVFDFRAGGCDRIAEDVRDFGGRSLLDGDQVAAGERKGEGGNGSGHEEGDVVLLSEDGYGVSANFIGHIAVEVERAARDVRPPTIRG